VISQQTDRNPLMAEMTIRLQIDPETGKKNIIVSLRSDDDALPHEHEQQHAALVEKLIQGGVLKAGELGQIVVEREEAERTPAGPLQAPGEAQRQAREEGNS
jgi:FtsH ternary system domain X3-analog